MESAAAKLRAWWTPAVQQILYWMGSSSQSFVSMPAAFIQFKGFMQILFLHLSLTTTCGEGLLKSVYLDALSFLCIHLYVKGCADDIILKVVLWILRIFCPPLTFAFSKPICIEINLSDCCMFILYLSQFSLLSGDLADGHCSGIAHPDAASPWWPSYDSGKGGIGEVAARNQFVQELPVPKTTNFLDPGPRIHSVSLECFQPFRTSSHLLLVLTHSYVVWGAF